jgi:predicted porin
MIFPPHSYDLKAQADSVFRTSGRKAAQHALAAMMGLGTAASSFAIEFGPDDMFSLKGFGEVTVTRANNQCPAATCQLSQETDRQKNWADAIKQGIPLTRGEEVFSQTQLWLGANYNLGQGYKLNASLSQNWRDGKADVKGFWREKYIAVSHEYYGTLTAGHMTSRAWQFADYPFGTNLGLSQAWAGTGAAYRNLTNAIRYTSPVLFVDEGDLVLEATYDGGSSAFKTHKPRFLELWAHYGKGPLSVDAMYQNTRNGVPSSFGAAAFRSPFHDNIAEGKLGGSGQSVALLQTVYQLNPKVELSAAVRHNRWSGAYAVIVKPGPPDDIWNFPFNVDWSGSMNGVPNPGYAAKSTDFALGARYRMDKWTFSTGMAYMGKASTANPSERGQSNSALVNTLQATYNYGNGWEVTIFGGMIHYRKKGLAPLSMPSNATLSGIDSRVTKAGNWFGVGAKYQF